MAGKIGEMFVEIRAKFDNFRRDLKSAESGAESSARNMERSFGRVERGIGRVTGAAARASAVLAATVGVAGIIDQLRDPQSAQRLRDSEFGVGLSQGILPFGLSTINERARFTRPLSSQRRAQAMQSAILSAPDARGELIGQFGNGGILSRGFLESTADILSERGFNFTGSLIRDLVGANRGGTIGELNRRERAVGAFNRSAAAAADRLAFEQTANVGRALTNAPSINAIDRVQGLEAQRRSLETGSAASLSINNYGFVTYGR